MSSEKKTYFRQHPLLARLHIQAPVVNEENKICTLAVAPLPQLELSFVGRGLGEVAIESQIHSHAAGLADGIKRQKPVPSMKVLT